MADVRRIEISDEGYPTFSPSKVHESLSIILTTSPVRSNPSADMIQEVFESFSHSPPLQSCPTVVVFDGYSVHNVKCEKKGRITKDMVENYTEFIKRVQKLTTSSPLFQNTSCLVLKERLGFGHAVRQALGEVSTKYVMIIQHDFAFCKDFDVAKLLECLEANRKINYIGFLSASTENYAMARTHGPKNLVLEIETFEGEPFVKLMFWYDKVHIARTDYYKKVVFGKYCCVRKGDFIEDRLGHWQLKKIQSEGLEVAHSRFGSYLWYPNLGQERYIQHLEGRKFQPESVKVELYPERMVRRRFWNSYVTRRYERQLQRSTTEVYQEPSPEDSSSNFEGC